MITLNVHKNVSPFPKNFPKVNFGASFKYAPNLQSLKSLIEIITGECYSLLAKNV